MRLVAIIYLSVGILSGQPVNAPWFVKSLYPVLEKANCRTCHVPDGVAGTMAAAPDRGRRTRSGVRVPARARGEGSPVQPRVDQLVRLRRREREPRAEEVDVSRVFIHGIGAVSRNVA